MKWFSRVLWEHEFWVRFPVPRPENFLMANTMEKNLRSVNYIHYRKEDFAEAKSENISFKNGKITAEGGKNPSSIESAGIKTDFPFNEILCSVSASLSGKAKLISEISVSDENGWSPWFRCGEISEGESFGAGKQKNGFGEADADIIKLDKYASAFRYRITVRSDSPAEIFTAGAVITDKKAVYSYEKGKNEKNIQLSVPAYSQLAQPSARAKDLCSPTSLSMVLNANGINISPTKAAETALDRTADIYGNWHTNTAALGIYGLPSFLARINSYKTAYELLKRKFYIMASLTYGENELTGAPVPKTKGHFVVLTGFDKTGDVLVNDPAGPDEYLVRRIYRRSEFEKAWLDVKWGLCYIAAKDLYPLGELKKICQELK